MIYLVDIIGKHSGMHYYDASFSSLLRRNHYSVKILSNYIEKQGEKVLLYNFFEGNLGVKLVKLLISYIRYLSVTILHPKSCFIYQSFGGWLDILFMIPAFWNRRFIVDMHECVALDSGHCRSLLFFMGLFYRYVIKCVIIHSQRSFDYIKQIDAKVKVLYIPHFKYEFDKNYDSRNISTEVKSLFRENVKNFLFFGHIRLSKGIDLFLDTLNILDEEEYKKCHFIVAGNDTDHYLEGRINTINPNLSFSSLLRYIKDEELNYLYDRADYIVLPYKEISQSGILEVAAYFRKPVILSRIDYFEKFLSAYPSFGISFISQDPYSLKAAIQRISQLPEKFYSDKDLASFYAYDDIKAFLVDFQSVMNNNQ